LDQAFLLLLVDLVFQPLQASLVLQVFQEVPSFQILLAGLLLL